MLINIQNDPYYENNKCAYRVIPHYFFKGISKTHQLLSPSIYENKHLLQRKKDIVLKFTVLFILNKFFGIFLNEGIFENVHSKEAAKRESY